MRTPDYLITTAHGTRSRRFIWHSHDPTPIESQEWFLEKIPYGVQVVHRSAIHVLEAAPRPIRIDPDSLLSGAPIDLPCDPFNENSRKFRLSIKLLTPLRAAYLPSLDLRTPDSRAKDGESKHAYYMFEGVRYFLSDFRQINRGYTGYVENVSIFSILRGKEGFQINVYRENLYFKVHGERRKPLRPGEISLISEVKFTQGSLQWGKNWWRVNRIRMPEAIPAVDFDIQHPNDATWLTRISRLVAVLCISFGVTLHYLPQLMPPKKVQTLQIDLTKIALKQPKIIPKKPEEPPKPLPTPVVVKPPPPKPLPPKEPPKPPPPQVVKKKETPPPKPKRQEVAKKIVPKKVIRVAANPPPVPNPRPIAQRPPPPVAPPKEVVKAPPQPAPPPAMSPAQLKAQQQSQLQAQLSKSLSFLSPSKNRVAPPSIYVESKDRKYGAASKEVSTSTKSSVLSKIASNSGADGPITTHASRSMSSEVSVGGRRKGLNDVQGRVSLSAVSGGGDLGSSLSNRGISLSGSGQISEAAVEKALAKHLSKFQYCYEKALLTDSSLAGTILMQWVISPGGGVSGIKVVRSQMNNAKLHDCISQELAKVQFPSPKGGPVIIKYPFAFSSSSL